jgi:hypothetical protein
LPLLKWQQRKEWWERKPADRGTLSIKAAALSKILRKIKPNI